MIATATGAAVLTLDDGLQAYRVAEAGELSRRSGRPVSLSEIADVPESLVPTQA